MVFKMSDTFDHMCDAYERMWNGDDGKSYSYRSSYSYDPLYYHKKYYFTGVRKVGGSYQIFYSDGSSFFVPKALVRKLTESSCYILQSFKPNRRYYSSTKQEHKQQEENERPKPTIPWEEAQYYL